MFKKSEVERALRVIKDCFSDLDSADAQTFGNHLKKLFYHMRDNSVLRVLHNQLISEEEFNYSEWYATITRSEFNPPVEPDKRIRALYQLLFSFENSGNESYLQFAFIAFGTTNFDICVSTINQNIVRELERELGYKIEEIEEGLGGDDSDDIDERKLIILPSLRVSFTLDKSTNINIGNVTGSNVMVQSSGGHQSIGPAVELVEKIAAALSADSNIPQNEKEECLSDLGYLKGQVGRPKTDRSIVWPILDKLSKVSSIATLVLKLKEVIGAASPM